MARRSNQKLKLLYLSKILLEQTDAQHGLTLSQILTELDKYGIQCGRKCLYDDIEALRVFGIDVCTRRDRYVRYYVASRNFDSAEVKLLFDFIRSCVYLNEKKAEALLKKLFELTGALPPKNDFENSRIGVVRELPNEDAYKNLDVICRAMLEDKKISFKCFDWNPYKQKTLLRNGEVWRVSPWSLENTDGKYRLIAFDEIKNEVVSLFPERLLSVSVSKQKREGRQETERYINSEGSFVNLRLRCDNFMASEVFERFGLGVTVLATREEWFEISVKTEINDALLSWIFMHGAHVRIVSPEQAVARYKDLIEKAQNNID